VASPRGRRVRRIVGETGGRVEGDLALEASADQTSFKVSP